MRWVPDQAESLRGLILDSFAQAAPPVILDSLATSASLIAGRIRRWYHFWAGDLVVDAGAASSLAAVELG